MIEPQSWVVQQILHKKAVQVRQEDILIVLENRYGAVPEDLAAELRTVTDEERLLELTRAAGRCTDLESFQRELRG